ncbi:MAG: nucleoside hydrolase [Stutzerimonas stutzeri]|nr:MAG: nucleoside hydrolase [Stutzerimonas stutzeri]
MGKYRKSDLSDVDVTFMDGEFKTYRITAGIGIGQYLAQQAANTGVLTLFNDEASHGIPLSNIREYVIRPVGESDAGNQ